MSDNRDREEPFAYVNVQREIFARARWAGPEKGNSGEYWWTRAMPGIRGMLVFSSRDPKDAEKAEKKFVGIAVRTQGKFGDEVGSAIWERSDKDAEKETQRRDDYSGPRGERNRSRDYGDAYHGSGERDRGGERGR